MTYWHERHNRALVFALALVACKPGGPAEPEPIEVPVQLFAAKEAGITWPMRVALVWKQGERWLSTFDAELASPTESTNVWFDLPARSERAALSDVSQAYISCDEEGELLVGGLAAAPRLVAYEDLDGSGNLDPDLPLNPGKDRVLALAPRADTSQYIAAFMDLDGVLSRMPMEYAECVRGFTSNRYSAFFNAQKYSDDLWALSGPFSARLELAPNPFAAVSMGCSAADVYMMVNRWSQRIQSQSTQVDVRLAPNPCLEAPWQCLPVKVGSLELPKQTAAVVYPGFSHVYTCTAVGGLDVLWFEESSLDCAGCDCDWRLTRQSWVVNAAEAPADWPCGREVSYCGERRASLWELPDSCSMSSLTRPD